MTKWRQFTEVEGQEEGRSDMNDGAEPEREEELLPADIVRRVG